jgi:hypothetical protein
MGILDIILLMLWALAWVWAFISGSDSLYKLFLWLIIWFLMYLVVAGQVELVNLLSPSQYDGYQNFLANNSTFTLTFFLLFVPILWIFFMLNSRLSFSTRPKSISQLLLGLLLPIFLIGMIAYLAEGSILSNSAMWQAVFSFLENSWIYNVFKKLPWGIFLLLAFVIFYKSIFLLIWAFFVWLWNEVIKSYFTNWDNDKKKEKHAWENHGEEDWEE